MILLAIAATLFLLPALIGYVAFCDGRSRIPLSRWEAESGYRVVWKRYQFLRHGPYQSSVTNGHAVWRLTLVGPDGVERRGYARQNLWFDPDRIDVTLDDARG